MDPRHDDPIGAPATSLDLDAIAAELASIEVALERLDAGTYWTCEATGADLPDDLLAVDPIVRRLPVPSNVETSTST